MFEMRRRWWYIIRNKKTNVCTIFSEGDEGRGPRCLPCTMITIKTFNKPKFISPIKLSTIQRRDHAANFPERLSATNSKILYSYAFRPITTGVESQEAFKERNTNYTQFFEEVQRPFEVSTQIYFRDLDRFLAVENLTFSDLMHILGIPFAINDEVQTLTTFCGRLNEASKRSLLRTLTLMTPVWWREKNCIRKRASYRAVKAYDQKLEISDCDVDFLAENEALQNARNDRWYCTRIDLGEFPALAEALNVSLHWLLRDFSLVYSKDEMTERIIDAYYFLLPEQRRSVLYGMTEALKEG